MRVLVTGASGFTGRKLVQRLAQADHEVVALTRSPHDAIDGAASIVRGDLTDRAMYGNVPEGIDGVCHTAAAIVLGGTAEEQENGFSANVRATFELLRFCEARNIERFIYSSSASVYARRQDGEPVDEATPVDPATPYASSKLAGEWLASSRALRLRAVILRYSSVYGAGQRSGSVLPLFMKKVMNGQRPAIHGSGMRSQDFVHVGDVCQANLLALEAALPAGEIFNIGSGEETSMQALAQAVSEQFGGSGFDRIAVEHEDRTRFRFDVSKARHLLGYTPRNLADGLRSYSAL